MDTPGRLCYINSDDMYDLRIVHVAKEVIDDLGDPEVISVGLPDHIVPDNWYSVYKGVGGGEWVLIAVVDTLQTAQVLMNTMEIGKIKNGEVQIEIKNSHQNESVKEES